MIKFTRSLTFPQFIVESIITFLVGVGAYFLITNFAAVGFKRDLLIALILTYIIRKSVITITWR